MSFNVSTDQKYTKGAVLKRFGDFKNKLGDPTTKPASVFNPLNPKQMEELILIREVSRELQKKKDEEQAKVEEVEVAVVEAEVKQDETSETKEETEEETKEETKEETQEETQEEKPAE